MNSGIKMLLSFLAHLLWAGVMLLGATMTEITSALSWNVLLEPYMTLILYPIITHLLVLLIYKIKPLTTELDRKGFIYGNIILTLMILLYLIPFYMSKL